jgi:two-component system CheB/CheR fusion protein
LFEPVSKKWRIYRRIGPDRRDRVEIPIAGSGGQMQRRPADFAVPRLEGFRELAQTLLVDRFAPAAVLINRKHEVLYFHGPTFHYLEQPTGEPTTDLILLAHESLRTKLRAVIHKAVADGAQSATVTARLKRPNGSTSVVVTAHQARSPKSADGLLLVTFVDVVASPPSSDSDSDSNIDESLVRQLEHELTSTREDLQSSIEELESSNEQLKASNEEVMSMNEELQSSNEELETSKEELQSLNEELGTVNNQLQEKIEELERSTNDLSNLLTCTDIATIFLDPQMRILRFTPATKLLLNLIATDIGRPISDIAPKFSDEILLQDCEEVLRQLIPREHTVRTRDGRWNLRRVLPYRTADNRIDGVIITFTDVTKLKQAEADISQLNTDLERRVAERTSELEITTRQVQEQISEREQADQSMRESRNQLAAILDTAAEGIISIDERGRIQSYNKAAEVMFGYSFSEIAGENVSRLMPDPESAAHDDYLATYLQTNILRIIGIRREVRARRRDGSIFPMDLAVSELRVGDHRLFTGVMRDISDRRELERQVLEIAAEEQRRIGQDLHDSVGQELTGLGLVADSLVECFEKAHPPRPDLAAKIAAGIHGILRQVRDLSHGLAPVEVDAAGLMAALRELAAHCREQSGIACAFTCRDPVLVENNTTATHLFLIAREAVTNALKHAQPKHVNIRLETDERSVVLTIQDDGKGLSGFKPGVGLRIMRHRAGLINATLDLKPMSGKGGAVVICTLPKGAEQTTH